MTVCCFCRKLLSVNKRLVLSLERSISSTSIKLSDAPKPSKGVAKRFKELVVDQQESKRSSHIGKEFIVTLDNIFSDSNRKFCLEKIPDAKAIPRPDSEKMERRAAVLVPMCYVKGEPSFLFMVRSVHLKNHRGEISFPGGMEDPGDRDLIHTALRETYEEIGLPMDRVEVWGQMQPAPSKITGSWVTPVLGHCDTIDLDKLHLNPSEVEDVFTVPVATLCDPANQRQTQWRYPGTIGYTLPVFLGGKYRIWGMTAIVVHQVLTVLASDLYHFTLKHRR